MSRAMRDISAGARRKFLLSSAAGIAVCLAAPARADCILTPTPGDDIYLCDSGTAPGGLTDPGGNNRLTLPAGGSGIIGGNVTFGGGTDAVIIASGRINGSVDQGDGADRFEMSGGIVTGQVQQGEGIDDFVMTAGEINVLNQGGALDTFFMSGGRIVDAFDDGDIAIMTGGRIGRVNMKLADNRFDMSGGTIDRNLVAGFGNDTIILSGGTIGGNISISGGADSVTITGGSVGGDVLLSVGTDRFVWNGGGVVHGTVDLGGDDDEARLANLTDAHLGGSPRITGGTGADTLAFANVTTGNVARFDGWERIDATDDTELTFGGFLTLGDAGTGTGVFTLDASSTIFGGGANAGIAAFTAGQRARLINAGRIDLTNGGGGPGDIFTVRGDYVGNGGLLLLNTVLGNDASASDRLVIDGGSATGTTSVTIVNAGGHRRRHHAEWYPGRRGAQRRPDRERRFLAQSSRRGRRVRILYVQGRHFCGDSRELVSALDAGDAAGRPRRAAGASARPGAPGARPVSAAACAGPAGATGTAAAAGSSTASAAA